jgi:hypothetical protein
MHATNACSFAVSNDASAAQLSVSLVAVQLAESSEQSRADCQGRRVSLRK